MPLILLFFPENPTESLREHGTGRPRREGSSVEQSLPKPVPAEGTEHAQAAHKADQVFADSRCLTSYCAHCVSAGTPGRSKGWEVAQFSMQGVPKCVYTLNNY